MEEIVYSPDGGVTIHRAVVDSTGALKTTATFTGTVTTQPTYKVNPADTTEAPKYGKVSATTGNQIVEGTVGVNNFPATQPVSGSVAVSNLPTTQPISGNVGLLAGSNFIGYTAPAPVQQIANGDFFIAGSSMTTSLTTPNAYMTINNPSTSTKGIYIVHFSVFSSDTGLDKVSFVKGATDTNATVTPFNPNLNSALAALGVVRAGTVAITGGTTLSPAAGVTLHEAYKFEGLIIVPPNNTLTIEVTGAASGSNIMTNIFWYEQ